jgi:hypothetical protein
MLWPFHFFEYRERMRRTTAQTSDPMVSLFPTWFSKSVSSQHPQKP